MLWRNARDDELPQLQRLLGADSALRPHIAPMLLLHALSRLLRPRKRNGGETQHGLRVRPNDTPATVVARTIGRLPRRPASPAEAARELEVLTTAIQLLSAQELPAAYEAIFALRTQATWMTEWLSRLLASQLARRGGVAALLHMVLDDSRPTPVWEQADRAAAMVAGAITDAKAMAEEDGVSGDASAEQLASVCHQRKND